jgi:hypothetical protein
MKYLILYCLLLLIACTASGQSKKSLPPVKINWVPGIEGNFSFAKKWSYPEGIGLNEFGQLVCDGFCPPETAAMVDSTGKIYKDSLTAYYKITDTTHQFHSIQCKAWCYEWAGTDFIEAVRKSVDTVYCYTLMNVATHCSLQFNLVNNDCYAIVDLKSIIKGGSEQYNCTNGYITIDKNLWEKGTLRAVFSFNFEHKAHPEKPIYWKGKIFAKIKKG